MSLSPRQRRASWRGVDRSDQPGVPMTATTSATPEYVASPTSVLRAANGIDYVYREVGDGAPPLVLLQHFRGNLDNWDPALIDALASGRRVITFNNVGVASTSGRTPNSIKAMAH